MEVPPGYEVAANSVWRLRKFYMG